MDILLIYKAIENEKCDAVLAIVPIFAIIE